MLQRKQKYYNDNIVIYKISIKIKVYGKCFMYNVGEIVSKMLRGLGIQRMQTVSKELSCFL